ncbi:hypothetical protein [Streptomyces soliscabiei]|uniref:hypothetical protein n=1 Tax=Streptomyces soliscabiei TaxID=588897 RepID=UPI0029B53952|nr:hypothetical protein [Streptomyces sp. NY05-11A]MDX2676415.1 hypothetical protein [Streptomyces sp. NY05-11A]
MGLDYSYEIFTPAQNVADALFQLAELAPRTRRVPPLTLTLPGGDQVVVPFTSNFKSEPVDCSTRSVLELDTSLMVGVDDAVREFFAVEDSEFDELGRIAIGYVYLTVRFAPVLHPRYASLQFTAATSGMSRMFERSASIRAVFTGLTAAIGGVCCVLDTESDVLTICWLNGQSMNDTVPGPRFASDRDLVATWPDQDR